MNKQTSRPVLRELQEAILRGEILSFDKVKPLPTGKVHITAGKYQTAVPVPGKRFAVFLTGKHYSETKYFISPYRVATFLISFAGREICWNALGEKR